MSTYPCAIRRRSFDQHYPADKYPLIRQKYDFVNRLMSETYHIDLKAIAQGPRSFGINSLLETIY